MSKKVFLYILAAVIIIGGIIIIAKIGSNDANNEGEQTNKPATVETNEVIVNETQFVQTLEDGTKYNTSKELDNVKTFQGLKISNIQITNKDGKTQIIADIENPTSENKDAMLVDVVLYDRNKNVIATLGGRISPIRAGKTMQFSTSSMKDYSNVYDFEFKLKQ